MSTIDLKLKQIMKVKLVLLNLMVLFSFLIMTSCNKNKLHINDQSLMIIKETVENQNTFIFNKCFEEKILTKKFIKHKNLINKIENEKFDHIINDISIDYRNRRKILFNINILKNNINDNKSYEFKILKIQTLYFINQDFIRQNLNFVY